MRSVDDRFDHLGELLELNRVNIPGRTNIIIIFFHFHLHLTSSFIFSLLRRDATQKERDKHPSTSCLHLIVLLINLLFFLRSSKSGKVIFIFLKEKVWRHHLPRLNKELCYNKIFLVSGYRYLYFKLSFFFFRIS